MKCYYCGKPLRLRSGPYWAHEVNGNYRCDGQPWTGPASVDPDVEVATPRDPLGRPGLNVKGMWVNWKPGP